MAKRLRPEEDAFGHALYDHFRGLDGREIVERSDGYIDSVNVSGYFATYDQWPESVQSAVRLIRAPFLDVGCGAGRFLLYAQEHGIECCGVDISPLAVEVCLKRGVSKVHIGSITDIGPDFGSFRTLLFMGNNFGLLGSAQRARRLLRKFHRLMPRDGRIIGNVIDPYRTSDPFHLDYQEVNRRSGRMAGQLRLRIRYKRYKTPWFDYLFVSPDEMAELAAETGWNLREVFESGGPAYVGVLEKA